MRMSTVFLTVIPFYLFALPGVEILQNSYFEGAETDRMPTAWETGGDGEVIWNRQEESSTLTLRATRVKQFTFARQTALLPSETPAALLLVADVRTDKLKQGEKNWHSGRIMISYLDAEGREIRNAYGLDRLEGDADWQEMRRQFPMESGATAVRLELQLFYAASGEISFRNVQLRALNATEAEAWRVEADERIETHRKADLDLTVLDEAGRPVPDAEVAIRMVRHAYPFGTAVKIKMLLTDENPENKIYQDVVTNFFNSATFEGSLKDRVIERIGIEPAVQALHWLKKRGLTVRGHVLIWPSWQMTPSSYKENQDNPEVLDELIQTHFRKTLEATKGLTVDWDVVNEPVFHHDVIDVFGREKVAEWFKWAREFEPDVCLYLNENNILLNSGNRQLAYDWVKYLQENGAPIDGLGIQGHMWHRTMPSGQNVLQDLDFLEPLGVRLQLTEYSANSRFSEADEARYLDELLHAWFSHPATAGFTTWGFKDDLIWTDNAFFFRKDWSLKPAGLAWLRRIYGEWWTEADGVTDEKGQYALRGFKGDYEVEVRHAGRKLRKAIHIGNDGLALRVKLDDLAEVDDPDTRLGSYNPWTTDKLPAVRSDISAQESHWVSVSSDQGEGAAALVPVLDPRPKGSYPLRVVEQPARDLYLRFDLSELPKKNELVGATLRIALAETVPRPGRIRIHALSYRFIRGTNELGLDWSPENISGENAPGRSASGGGFDLGDARVFYVGDLLTDVVQSGEVLTFSSREIRRLVSESYGHGLTLILSAPDAETLSIAGPGRGDELPGPSLTLEYKNP